jgi:glycosyltransferase involved in cell wall biosynthesis
MTSTLPRVLFFNQTGLYGGAERSLYDLVTHYPGDCRVVLMRQGPLYDDLSAAGVDAHVLATDGNGAPPPGWRGLTSRFCSIVLAMIGLVRLSRGYDLIYANSMKAAVIGAVTKPFHQRKLIWHLRSLLIPEHFTGLARWVARWCGNYGIDLVIANSNATARAYQTNGGKHRPLTAYNGFALNAFMHHSRRELRAQLVREHGLDPARPIIGMIGRIGHWKGQVPALMGLSMGTNWQFMVVGEALFESEKFRQDFREKAAHLAQGGNVFFLGHRNDVAEIMGGVDVVIHASTLPEPFGRVIVEAMLAGTPVIASNGGGVPEILEDGVTGRLVEPNNAPALRAVIAAALCETEKSQRMAIAARAYAERTFALEVTLPPIWQALRNVAAQTAVKENAPDVNAGA